MDIFYIAIVCAIFIGAIITAVMYHRFYKKYDIQLRDVFCLLQRNAFVRAEDYGFYENLGIAGFGFRMSLLNKILKGQRFQIAKGRWIEPQAKELILRNFDVTWVHTFYKLILVISFLFIIMMGMALIV